MSRSFKKTIALLLSTVVLASLMAGCQSKKENTPASTPAASSTKTEEPAKRELITISWLNYNTYAQPDPNSPIIKKMEEKYNVKFDFWFVDDQKWDELLGVKLSSGDMPDVLKIKNTSNIPSYVKQGVLAELTPEIQEMLKPKFDELKKYDSENVALLDCYYDGKLYAFKSPQIQGDYPTVLIWRKDWLKKAGIDKMPATLDEFEKAVYSFANDDPDGNGKKDTFGMSNTSMNAVFGAYGPIPLKEYRGTGTQNLFYMKDSAGKIAFAAVQPEMKEALTTLNKWYKDGVIDPEFVTGENKAGYWATSQDFENAKVGVTGMALASHYAPPYAEGMKGGSVYEAYMAVNPTAKFGETFDIGGAVTGPKGKSGLHCWGYVNTAAIGITTKAAKDPEKVKRIAEIMTDSDFETYVLGYWGIEGEHYTVNDKGVYARTEAYAGNAEQIKAGVGVIVNGTAEFAKKTNPLNYEWLDKYRTAGYSDITVPQTESASLYLEDLKKLTLETYIKFITGEKNLSEWDSFVEQFNKNGGAKIIEEINAGLK